MNQHAEMEDHEDSRPNGFFTWWKDRFMGHDDYEDDEEEAAIPAASSASDHSRASGGSAAPLKNGTTLRLDQTRQTHVTVRRAMRSFDDAGRAANGLKSGQQQIVNLEQTPVEMAERIIDFLNGATYALDGSVEKIGEQVYLFTPASVLIAVDDKSASAPHPTFLEQIGIRPDAV